MPPSKKRSLKNFTNTYAHTHMYTKRQNKSQGERHATGIQKSYRRKVEAVFVGYELRDVNIVRQFVLSWDFFALFPARL